MSIWYYENTRNWSDADTVLRTSCLYCETLLKRDAEAEKEEVERNRPHEPPVGTQNDKHDFARAIIGICPACGWWKYGLARVRLGPLRHSVPIVRPRDFDHGSSFEISLGSLKTFDLADPDTPVTETRDYLTARFEARFDVHPRLFEEVVASVFRDHGYSTRVTAYSGDGGIDVILDGANDQTIGVQVKRYRNRITVAEIRELTGALVIGGHTKGVFVTTSDYQSGADGTARASTEHGYPIELYDATRFYDALKIAQLSSSREVSRKRPWHAERK